jgi:hypothetical protein
MLDLSLSSHFPEYVHSLSYYYRAAHSSIPIPPALSPLSLVPASLSVLITETSPRLVDLSPFVISPT